MLITDVDAAVVTIADKPDMGKRRKDDFSDL